jgi:phosphatidyl-myo-inositol dimannoside synthase
LLLERSWDLLEQENSLEVYTVRKLAEASSRPSYRTRRSLTASGNRGRFIKMVLQQWAIQRPDVVVFGHLNFSPLGLVMQLLRPHCAVATIVHGIEAWGQLPPITSLALRRSTAVWSVSAYTASMLARNSRVSAAKIRLLPNSVPAEFLAGLRPNAEAGSSSRHASSLLSVSRLDQTEGAKGIDQVLAALPSIAAHIPDVSYTVIGTGSDMQRLREIAANLRMEQRVKFLGGVDDATLMEAYRACDVFVLPSAKEGFGLVFAEAMAAGKPVVAAKAGAAREVIDDNQSGILVDYGDVDGLAKALTSLLSDNELRQRMGQAARRSVEMKFRFETYVDRLSGLIGELADRSPSS